MARRSAAALLSEPPRPRPSPAQLDWQRDELAMFLHFGVNTFTDREWGEGREDPAIFNPTQLDARQWARTARDAGFRTLILTAKHHDGFCLWPTRTTNHSVAHSMWRNGQGDVVRELVDACRAEGLKAGLYLSPWDRHEPVYGDSSRYNDFYCAQLTELYRRYVQNAPGRRFDVEASVALEDCKKGNAAEAIPVLEKKLRENRITPPGGGEFKP